MEDGERVFIIAEAGVNHNGSLALAMELVDAAAQAGADAVKFQAFKSGDIATAYAAKAEYQLRDSPDAGAGQLEMLRQLELNEAMHLALRDRCRKKRIGFMSTAFDLESLEMLCRLGVDRLKIPSGEIESGPLLLAAARTNLPVIVSTGGCSLADVENALGVLAFGYLGLSEKPGRMGFIQALASPQGIEMLCEKVTLLHCTTEYPAPLEQVNLYAMNTLRGAFGLATGYSDHTLGIVVPTAAAALGAVVIEKHFTMDRNLPGPDHRASVEPEELAAMVRNIRAVEVALGSRLKAPGAMEFRNRLATRKSLVAKTAIGKGEVFSEKNVTFKRPGTGVSPLRYWDYLGRMSDRPYEQDELLA